MQLKEGKMYFTPQFVVSVNHGKIEAVREDGFV